MVETFFDKIRKNKTLHTPDVLSCLANLSNDEVFTPPDVANKMLDLLPQELFSDPNATFLDPACKTGVFLREIAKRLLVGLQDKIPDLQQRIDHIFHKQLFGIAITELTSLLSRRGLYCSKYPNGKYSVSHFVGAEGNIRFRRIQHTWVNGKCKFCGANQKEYDRGEGKETHAYEFIHTSDPEKIFNMKFDVIISNPPYQLSDGGGNGSSAMPIYQHFIEQDKKLKPHYIVMITPSRWFAGGKGLDEFRNDMLSDCHLKYLVDYANSAECFPGVVIAGGVNYFLWDREYCGDCTIENRKNKVVTITTRKLSEFNIFVRDNVAVSIIRKIKKIDSNSFDACVFSRNYFGIVSNENGHKEKKADEYILFSLKGYSYIDKNKVSDKANIAHSYKVIMTKAMSGGNKPSSDGKYQVASTIKILNPEEVCTETYLILKDFSNVRNAENLCVYVKTKFFRFLLLQALTSINISKEKFCFVPMQDFTGNSDIDWSVTIPEIDKQLYKKYDLSQEEIDFIESMIKPME